MYFEKPGRLNTEETVKLAIKTALERKIQCGEDIIAISGTGRGADTAIYIIYDLYTS